MEQERFPIDQVPYYEKVMNVDGEPTMIQHETNRGISSYEQIFGLTPDDVNGKVVVHLGSSRHQQFADEIDRSDRYEPKMMISVDPLAEFKEREKHHVVAAKAEAMPFHNNVELLLACNSVPLYLRTPESIQLAFDEIVDSLSVGSEARIFPIAYSPLGHGYDAETQTISPSKICYPPNDNGVFDNIFETLKQKHQLQLSFFGKAVRDPENPEEKIQLMGVKIRKTGEDNPALDME